MTKKLNLIFNFINLFIFFILINYIFHNKEYISLNIFFTLIFFIQMSFYIIKFISIKHTFLHKYLDVIIYTIIN